MFRPHKASHRQDLETLDSRWTHSGTTESEPSSGKESDFEPPRPLAAILRDAKRANSPASAGREFPDPAPTTTSLPFHHRFTRPFLSQLHHFTGQFLAKTHTLSYTIDILYIHTKNTRQAVTACPVPASRKLLNSRLQTR